MFYHELTCCIKIISNSYKMHPAPLKKGDTIAIVSPASIIDPTLVERASATLNLLGYKVKVAPHALGKHGSYSGTMTQRLDDISNAFLDPEVRAILCSRGGYGCVHLLDALSHIDLTADPKWLIGFSDVSALHALMASRGIVSIHGSMAKALALYPHSEPYNNMLLSMLRGVKPGFSFPAHHHNHPGTATGRLLGGNLAVLQALISTPYDIFNDCILFIEDVAEPIYKVERILYQLLLAGRLNTLKGLIIGQFTLYEPDRNFNDIYDMMAPVFDNLDIPVAFNAPIGHIPGNMPLLHGDIATLNVTPEKSELKYSF